MKLFFTSFLIIISSTITGQVKNAACNPDTSRIAILPFSIYYVSTFDTTFKAASLNSDEYCLLQKIIVSYFNNEELIKYNMGYGEYRYQCVPVRDSTAKKFVVVNGFCIRSGSYNHLWKEVIFLVRDGGPCYFIGLIDLGEKKVKDLIFNAE